MELEFDKEIDALLRKARSPSAAAPTAPAGGHLDADEFAAFAENALPERSRQMYIAHLADCDTCRKTLSGFISTVPTAAPDAAFDAAAPAVVNDVPWFRRLFAIPSLVYTLGGLLVVFTGFVGLLLYQSGQNGGSAVVSKVTEKAPVASQPASETDERASESASTANTAANSSSPIDGVTTSGVEVGSASPASSDTVVAEEKQQPVAGQDETATAGKRLEVTTADSTVPSAKPAEDQPAAPPKAAPVVANTESDAKLDAERNRDKSPELARGEKTKEANVVSGAVADDGVRKDEAAKKSEDKEMRSMREAPASSAKTAQSRIEGPRQVQNQVATQNNEVQNNLPINGRNVNGAAAAAATRSVGGKTFTLRSGIWYDSAYSGGGTKDVKRGSDKYQKLDEGLRSITDSISGTVVVVWKGTSYKIR